MVESLSGEGENHSNRPLENEPKAGSHSTPSTAIPSPIAISPQTYSSTPRPSSSFASQSLLIARTKFRVSIRSMKANRNMLIFSIIMIVFVYGVNLVNYYFMIRRWTGAGAQNLGMAYVIISMFLAFFFVINLFSSLMGFGLKTAPPDVDWIFPSRIKPSIYVAGQVIYLFIWYTIFALPVAIVLPYAAISGLGLSLLRIPLILLALLSFMALMIICGSCVTLALSIVRRSTIKLLLYLFTAVISLSVILPILTGIGSEVGTNWLALLSPPLAVTSALIELSIGEVTDAILPLIYLLILLLPISMLLSRLARGHVYDTIKVRVRKPEDLQRLVYERKGKPQGQLRLKRPYLQKGLLYIRRSKLYVLPIVYLALGIVMTVVMGRYGDTANQADEMLGTMMLMCIWGAVFEFILVLSWFTMEKGVLWVTGMGLSKGVVDGAIASISLLMLSAIVPLSIWFCLFYGLVALGMACAPLAALGPLVYLMAGMKAPVASLGGAPPGASGTQAVGMATGLSSMGGMFVAMIFAMIPLMLSYLLDYGWIVSVILTTLLLVLLRRPSANRFARCEMR